MVRSIVFATLALVLAPSLLAAEDEKVEKAPAPKKADDAESAPTPRRVEEIIIPYYQRENRYARWQMYGVARSNQWRPRVVYSPNGPYYLYNGAPFPLLPVRQTEFQSATFGAPYRAAPARMPYCE